MSTGDVEKLFQMAVEKIVEPSLRAEIGVSHEGHALSALPKAALEEEKPEEPVSPEKNENLAKAIKEMSVPQRMKLAMFGNQTARTILLRDANRLIPLFVLENPRITDNEILEISKNTQVDDAVLRQVGNNLEWMRNYAVKIALVSNAKTPLDIALRWLKYIKEKDLGRLAKSKNIPQVISTQAKKLVEKRDKSGG